jgi:hypothetical protein
VKLAICNPPSPGTIPSLDADSNIPTLGIESAHWQEWRDSGVDPAIIAANVRSLTGDQGYDYLCYGDRLTRTNTGRLSATLLQRYRHTENGGWWCQGLDPLAQWQSMLWGCFKPNTPRLDRERQKVIKYEHPPQVPTRAFFLNVPKAQSSTSHTTAKRPETVLQPCTEFWSSILADHSQPIILVEGAKKAGCLLSLGYAAIALPGVFNGRRVTRNEQGQAWAESLLPDLLPFAVPGRRVYICFDHDTKPTTVKNVNLAIWRTGQLLKQQGCHVHVINLPGPEKGVDEFVVARGAQAFAAIFAQAQALQSWQWHQKKQADLTWTPWHRCNTADFTQAVVALPAVTEGILVLSSAKGTGKTQAIARLIRHDTPVIAVGHRIALMRNLCDRLELNYKDDLDKVNGRFMTPEGYTLRLGLCADSLLAIDPHQFVGSILVIDEFMQVLRHLLTSATCNQDGKRPGLLARLGQLVRAAKLVILADADAADVGIRYIHQLKGANTPVALIRNDYQSAGFPVHLVEATTDDAIVQQLLADLQTGQKIFIATDSLSSCAALAKLIKQVPNVGPGLVINSETSGRKAERAVITNPNQEIQAYRWVLATPSLATGVSIEVDHFDRVYGLFYGVSTDADIAQALHRVRKPIPRVVWCTSQGKNFHPLSQSESAFDIEHSLKLQLHREAAVLRASLGCPDTLLPELFTLAWDNNPHLRLFTHLVAQANAAMWSLWISVQERLRFEGNAVEIIAGTADPALKSTIKQARAETKAEHVQALVAASILTTTEINQLERQDNLDPSDKLNLEKSRIAEFLALDTVSVADVEFYHQHRGGLLQLEALLYGTDLATKRDLQAIARQTQWGQGLLPFDQPYYELKRFVRDRLGLLPFLAPDQPWANTDLEPLGNAARHHRQQIKEILGFTIPPDPTQASNGWIFRMLCQQLGLKITTYFKGPRGHQVKYYALDPVHYQIVLAVLQRRGLKRHQQLTSETSLDLVSTPIGLNKIGGESYENASQRTTPDWTGFSQELQLKIQHIVATIHHHLHPLLAASA